MKATKPRVLIVFGTRPEAIKMAPVVNQFTNNQSFEVKVCVTAQHREMLDQILRIFDITPAYDLDIMQPGQDLFQLTARILQKMKAVLTDFVPQLVVVHGDTTTSFVAALAAFYLQIPVAHVEAGLRTGDVYAPFPEEMNRKITGAITRYHFAPTQRAAVNLQREGIVPAHVFITGNTVIDALQMTMQRIEQSVDLEKDIQQRIARNMPNFDINRPFVLMTGHRRENFGQGFVNICKAIQQIAQKYPDYAIVYPVHLNPNVQQPVFEMLNGLPNVFLSEPMDYLPFLYLMSRSYLVLTDSGGIQEEAPGLGKPVLVMREVTERPEAVEAGTVKLVGTDAGKILQAVVELIENKQLYVQMSKAHNPYGDGTAALQIVKIVEQQLTR